MRNSLTFLFLVFILLISLFVTAKASEIFIIQGKEIQFFNQKNTKIRVSKHCYNNSKCMALKQLETLTKDSFKESEFYRGPHPGAVICEKNLRGQSVYGSNEKGTTSFCLFKDQSLIDNGSILYSYQRKVS